MRKNIVFFTAAVALCVYWFFLMLPQIQAPRWYDRNTSNAYLFLHGSHYAVVDTNLATEFPAWQPRVAAQWTAGLFADWGVRHQSHVWTWNGYDFGAVSVAFAAYQTMWLAVVLVAVWHYRKRDALLVSALTYAGMTYNLAMPSGCWFLPWDGPSMAFFTVAWLAWVAEDDAVFWCAALLSAVFKEAGVVLLVLPLLGRRYWQAAACAGVAFLVRMQLMQDAQVHTVALPWNNATGIADFFAKLVSQVGQNTHELARMHLNSFFFAGCGLVVLLFFLRARWQIKALAAAFVAGQFCFGYAHEFREWGEILPLAACVASDNLKENHELEHHGEV